MSDFLDRFERQLVAARRPPRRRPSRRGAMVASMLVLLIGAPALAATEPWRPLIGDEKRGMPSATTDSPPSDQARGLGVLRRAQTEDDRGPLAQEALRLTDDDVEGVRTKAVRVMRSPVLSAVLVPVERFNLRTSQMIQPEMSEKLKRRLEIKQDGLCVFAPDPGGDGGGFACSTLDEIKQGALPSSIGGIMYGLVPDNVRRVDIQLADGSTLESAVDDNFYAARAPRTENQRPPRIDVARWIGGDGQTLEELRAPQPPAAAARHPSRR
jgi:hypothetical protein